MANTQRFEVWQWNCRSILNKKDTLQQLLRTIGDKPKVIMLQETLTKKINFTGYKTVGKIEDNGGRGVVTLVDKKLPFVEHDLKLGTNKIEYVLTEIVLKRQSGKAHSIFCLNVCSSPKDKKQSFRAIFNKTLKLASTSPLVIGGDFNAAHHTWGYTWYMKKGEDLWNLAVDLGLRLITDPAYPMRCGTSSCRDTTPDLTFVHNATEATWGNSGMDLGRDHYIVRIGIGAPREKTRVFKYTDWDLFRKIRAERTDHDEMDARSYKSWIDQLGQDLKKATKEIIANEEIESMDSKLAHMIEAKQSILKR